MNILYVKAISYPFKPSMKRHLVSMLLLVACAMGAFAQSTMTDQQIMEYVMEEQQKGTSQSQIVTKLMQRGVTR